MIISHTKKKRFFQCFLSGISVSKTFEISNNNKIVSTTGLSSNYIKGDYDEIYGEGGNSRVKQLFNYSGYSQFDAKINKFNFSLGMRLDIIFEDDNQFVPVFRN